MRKRIFNFQLGYTLIELLAVITIVVVVGVIITGILISSLRGGNKSNVLDNVRQNGNSTITQMSKMIIYAQSFNGMSDGTVDSNGNRVYITNCTQIISPSPSPSSPPTPTPKEYHYIKITSFDGGTTVFGCNGLNDIPPNTIASNGASMIDTTLETGVKVSSCSFTCSQDGYGFPPTIGINFTLSQNTTSSFAEKKAIIPFQTSVTIRNNNL